MSDFWFHRMAEYWVVPTRLDLVQLTRRARLQLVQAGTFGPMFYGLADDPSVDRNWVGMPLVGVEENLALAAELIPQLQEEGAKVVGQMSLAWHYGDHETGRGLFGMWDRLWTDELLGPAPGVALEDTLQRAADGSPRTWPIEDRPYRTYSGCICNPHWLAVLEPMVKKAIDLGVDGFNAHHNFERFCHCGFCRDYLTARLTEELGAEQLAQVLDPAWPPADAEHGRPLAARPDAPPELRKRFEAACERAMYRRRKELFDALFIDYGRQLKPDLLLAQWYHKYNLDVWDERCLLADDEWARDEDYIWYSQGPHKNLSRLADGYLADTGLAARYVHAMSRGKPMVLNKYDSKRLRLSIAEAGANHHAALAFHYWGDEGIDAVRGDYTGPIERYQRFLADHEALFHPAQPWSQVGLVYPRRAELAGESGSLEPLKRLGRFMEDGHVPFDIVLDVQLHERAAGYEALVLPEIARLTEADGDCLRRFVEAGGKLVFTAGTGAADEDGMPHATGLLADWQAQAPQGVHCLEANDWSPTMVEVRPGDTTPVHPVAQQDELGRTFLALMGDLLAPAWLRTDAPWYVRVRAWRPHGVDALVLHWVNYRQDEGSDIEVPQPVGPLQVECAVPEGRRVERVEWLYPEKGEVEELEYEMRAGRVCFAVPSVAVYGLSVLRWSD